MEKKTHTHTHVFLNCYCESFLSMVHFRYVKVSEDQDNIQHWAEKNPIENPLNILSNTHKTCGKPTNTGVST